MYRLGGADAISSISRNENASKATLFFPKKDYTTYVVAAAASSRGVQNVAGKLNFLK